MARNNFDALEQHDRTIMRFLGLVLQSAFIPNTKVISCMLIAKPSLGKTTYLDFLKRYHFVEYTIDITPKRIADFLDDVDNGKKKFLVIPDFISNIAHSKRTSDLARTIYREMMQTGVNKISIYGMEKQYKNNPTAGLITAITTDKANQNTGQWRSDGFYSRLLPFSYNHSKTTEHVILRNKFLNKKPFEKFDMTINENPSAVELTELTDKDIQILSSSIVEPTDAPYRAYDLVNALCKSNAVFRDSNVVEEQDVQVIREIIEYINRSQKPI